MPESRLIDAGQTPIYKRLQQFFKADINAMSADFDVLATRELAFQYRRCVMTRNFLEAVSTHGFKFHAARRYMAGRQSIARALLVLVFSMLLPAPDSIVPNRVLAADGDLNPGFGTTGIVTTDFSGGNDAFLDIAADLQGKIVVAGLATSSGTGSDFALARFDEKGNLDPTFGNGGKVTTDFFGSTDRAQGLAIQLDGKMVLAGLATNAGNTLFGFARYELNGNLDLTFGNSGKVTVDLGATEEALGLALQQEDGKIVAAGYSGPANNTDFTLVRLDSDGKLDPSFGSGGIVKTDFFQQNDRAIDLVLDGKDRIVVTGFASKSATDLNFAIVRLTSDGSVDPSFGNDGKVTTDFNGRADVAQAIAFQSNDKIVVGGAATDSTGAALNWAVVRYTKNGSLDQSFGVDGKTTINFGNTTNLIYDLIVQPDDKIFAVGRVGGASTAIDAGICRFDNDGNVDPTYGLNGRFTLDISGTNNAAFCGMLYLDNTLIGGNTFTTNSGDNGVIIEQQNKQFLEFTKEASPDPAAKGDIVTYTFTIKNLTDRTVEGRIFDLFNDNDVDCLPDRNWFVPGPGLLVSAPILVGSGETWKDTLRCKTLISRGVLKNSAKLGALSGTILLAKAQVSSEVKEPEINSAEVKGKKLVVIGFFGASSDTTCPVILIDGQEQKTTPDPENPSTLIAKKGGKKIAPGQTVTIKVRLCDGTETPGLVFTRPQ